MARFAQSLVLYVAVIITLWSTFKLTEACHERPYCTGSVCTDPSKSVPCCDGLEYAAKPDGTTQALNEGTCTCCRECQTRDSNSTSATQHENAGALTKIEYCVN